jgi:hypothetical protein
LNLEDITIYAILGIFSIYLENSNIILTTICCGSHNSLKTTIPIENFANCLFIVKKRLRKTIDAYEFIEIPDY